MAPEATAALPRAGEGAYWLSRIVVIRWLGALCAVAFAGAVLQNLALLGSQGLTPQCAAIERAGLVAPARALTDAWVSGGWRAVLALDWAAAWQRFLRNPSLFAFTGCDDDTLIAVPLVGFMLALVPAVLGTANWPLWAALWAVQASFVNMGGVTWYSFGWETQLMETLLWTLPALPLLSLSRFDSLVPPSRAARWYSRLLLGKIMLGAGLIKLRGDPCWRALPEHLGGGWLQAWFGGAGEAAAFAAAAARGDEAPVDTCMSYHYETQPNPHPLSPLFHLTPVRFHDLETLANHLVENAAPLLLLLPWRRARILGGLIQLGFQAVLIASGNLAFLNWLTMAPALWCVDDAFLAPLFPAAARRAARAAEEEARAHDAPRLAWGATRGAPMWCWERCCCRRSSGGAGGQQQAEASEADPSGKARPRPRSFLHRAWRAGYTTSRTAVCLGALCAALVLNQRVAENLLSPRQAMNYSFGDAFHLAGSYGAFGSVGKVRTDLTFALSPAPDLTTAFAASLPPAAAPAVGSVQPVLDESLGFREVVFPCKPGPLSRMPCTITPYHLRLDWLAWFAGNFGPYPQYPWAVHLADRLLEDAGIMLEDAGARKAGQGGGQAAGAGGEHEAGGKGGTKGRKGKGAGRRHRVPRLASLLRHHLHLPVAVLPSELLASVPLRDKHWGGRKPRWVRVAKHQYRFTPPLLALAVEGELQAGGVAGERASGAGGAPESATEPQGSESTPLSPAPQQLRLHLNLSRTGAAAAGERLCALIPPHWGWLPGDSERGHSSAAEQRRANATERVQGCELLGARLGEDGSPAYVQLRLPPQSPHPEGFAAAARHIFSGGGGAGEGGGVVLPPGWDIVDVGEWYARRWVDEWLPPLERGNPSVREFLRAHGWLGA